MLLNFAIALEKMYNQKFISTYTVDITKDMICFDLFTGMTAQSYYIYIRVATIM